MKEFWNMMSRYVRPYGKYLGGSVILSIFSAIFNIFSFTLIIPILRILFKLEEGVYNYIPWDADVSIKEKALGNLYAFVSEFMQIHGAGSTLFALCLFLCVITLLKTACYFGASAVMVPIRTGIVKDLRMQLYRKLLSLPIGFFSAERRGDIIARMSGDVQEVENSITASIEMLLKNPILIIFYMGTLFFISWKLTVFVLIFAPLMLLVMSAIARKLKATSTEAQALWSDTMSQVDETLGGLRVIKAFLAETLMIRRFGHVTEAMRRKNNRVWIRQASAHPVSEFLGTVMIAIVMGFGGSLILSSHNFIDAPTFIFYMVMLYSVIQPIKDLARAAYGIPKGLASMERIDRILDAENPIREAEHPLKAEGLKEGLRFEKVCFSYEDGKQVLRDIDLDIKKGQTVAIVGASGAGKSTLVDLIPRFWDPDGGRITLDGVPLTELSIASLRSLVGYVNQEPILFNDSIFRNIAFARPEASREEVEQAARIANAHDFIMEKEEGYETNIGDRGVKLSGGQRQRLSIARAVLKNPPILILDEATASLDTESERAVQEALEHLMSGRTTIAIAHRLSTIKNADVIIVMDEGRIVEKGKHEELLAKDGYYKKLNDMQAL
jgi:ATP-binding cassette subfamily B protein/subfamily B ATP-binding cassette protein MsbA